MNWLLLADKTIFLLLRLHVRSPGKNCSEMWNWLLLVVSDNVGCERVGKSCKVRGRFPVCWTEIDNNTDVISFDCSPCHRPRRGCVDVLHKSQVGNYNFFSINTLSLFGQGLNDNKYIILFSCRWNRTSQYMSIIFTNSS